MNNSKDNEKVEKLKNNIENIEKTKQVNIEIAINKTTISIIIIALLILYSAIWLIFNYISNNLIFASISLILIIIAKKYMHKNSSNVSEKCVFCSIVVIVFSFLLDIILICCMLNEPLILIGFLEYSLLADVLKVLYIVVTLPIVKVLKKVNKPYKYKENTDWFYDK